MRNVLSYFPRWIIDYPRHALFSDVFAGVIVGVLVIPQSLGYAALAGLPPIYGLYSAIVPVLVYAWCGASQVNAVGPVAITAMMTGQALQPYHHLSVDEYATLASTLAALVGTLLLIASMLRLGWVTQFISRGVSAGFISAASLLIIVSQIKYLGGFELRGNDLPSYLLSFSHQPPHWSLPTLIVGCIAITILMGNRLYGNQLFGLFLPRQWQLWSVRFVPLLVMLLAIVASQSLHFSELGIATIGIIPQGLPHFTVPLTAVDRIIELVPAAALLALVAFISSDAVAANFARQRGQAYASNQELYGLGWANFVGSLFQSFSVVGGFSRTALNVEAGAQTPLASVVSVVVMVVVLLYFTPYLAALPYAVLAATIVVAITSLIDLNTLRQAYRTDRLEAFAFVVTLASVLIWGLNTGLMIGIACSFASLIWQSSRPHIAIIGQVAHTGHFRNIERHHVVQASQVVMIRIDESLFYGNSKAVRQSIDQAVARYQQAAHIVLVLSAVNHIDLSAQEMLLDLNQQLKRQHKQLHYAEVKGPVMDVLQQTRLISELTGHVYLSTQQAFDDLTSAAS